jgi:AraC-like DNA-binding protein
MKPYFEKVPARSTAFVAYERCDPEFRFHWHYHPEYELTLILQSHGQRLVGDGIAEYGPGDLVLLGPNLPHSWRSGPAIGSVNEMHRAIVVQFREDFLGREFFRLGEMSVVASLLERSTSGLAFGQTAIGRSVASSLAKLPSLSPSERLIEFLAVLVQLAREDDAQLLSSHRLRHICRPEQQRRMDAICRYLNENYEEKLDFVALAEHFHMTQAALCRFFKRAAGRTLTAYVNELRVGAAAQLLIHTDESALDVCFRVGFGNYSNFCRQFKRIKGCGPRSLRRWSALLFLRQSEC